MSKWFLIYCKPGQDARAEENLLRQGYTVFRPTIRVVRTKIGRRPTTRLESLFPRYLFLLAEPEVKSITPVMSTLGVTGFVKFGDSYAVASQSLIDDIYIRIEGKAYPEQNQNLQSGDEIYISGHGFDQVKAIYCNPCGEQRSLILLDILGKQSHLSVPTECIAKQLAY